MRTKPMSSFLHVLFSFIITFSLGTLASCTKKSSTDSKYPKAETLYINLGSEPPTLDWTLAGDTTSASVILNIMDPLVETEISSPELPAMPGLFEKWEASKDHKTWTFTLRSGIQWSDGEPLISQHVVDAAENFCAIWWFCFVSDF